MPLSDDPRPAPWFVLPTPAGESILTEFNAGQVTSDGGLLWLARADEQTDGILGIASRDPLALDEPVFLDAIPSIGPIWVDRDATWERVDGDGDRFSAAGGVVDDDVRGGHIRPIHVEELVKGRSQSSRRARGH